MIKSNDNVNDKTPKLNKTRNESKIEEIKLLERKHRH